MDNEKITDQNPHTPYRYHYIQRLRHWVYPFLVILLYSTWLTYMFRHNAWHIFENYWQAAVTMIFGSFVAGSTAEGGAFIAFPVFTKLLHISSANASTFGLMIQSVGMTFASIFILLYRIPVLYRVIFWTALGGVLGVWIGLSGLYLMEPLPKILFTMLVFCFALILLFNRWVLNWPTHNNLNHWNIYKKIFFVLYGILGGIVSSKTGFGSNILIFILLILAFGIHEKIATPTSVIIMAIVSIAGFLIHGVRGTIAENFYYWLTAVPVVCIFAPLGAFVGARLTRDQVILFLVALILIEFISTLILIPFTVQSIYFSVGMIVISVLTFALMIFYRYQKERSN